MQERLEEIGVMLGEAPADADGEDTE